MSTDVVILAVFLSVMVLLALPFWIALFDPPLFRDLQALVARLWHRLGRWWRRGGRS
jgi:hypothetical protein